MFSTFNAFWLLLPLLEVRYAETTQMQNSTAVQRFRLLLMGSYSLYPTATSTVHTSHSASTSCRVTHTVSHRQSLLVIHGLIHETTVHRLVHSSHSVPTSCTLHRLVHSSHSVPASCTAHRLVHSSHSVLPHVQYTD